MKSSQELWLKWRLFGISLLVLFLELAFIRYLPAQISYLGYYSNFILLACFAGMGMGILLARKREVFWLFPWLLLLVITWVSWFPISIVPAGGGEIHFTSSFKGAVLPEIILVPAIFAGVMITVAFLSQKMGQLLNSLPPLSAYAWDIGGSLAGIILFTGLSFFRIGPVGWWSVFMVIFLVSNWEKTKKWLMGVVALGLVVVVLAGANKGAYWSPYQKVTVERISDEKEKTTISGYRIYVNNIAHQEMVQDISKKEWVYRVPYTLFNGGNYKNALIIGAGTGSDVGMAIEAGVDRIDAVEIDPVMVELGRKLHPNKPYQDARVQVFIDDARSFLQKSKSKYELIVFGLPDSLVLATGHGNIRLESFLFTKEAFESAKEHLNENGVLVLYNYYRQPWLVDKLGGMLREVFGKEPYIVNQKEINSLAALVVGSGYRETNKIASESGKIDSQLIPASDDWPFLYLSKQEIPLIYLVMFLVIGLGIYLGLSKIIGKPLYKEFRPTYFFLGLGFFLLETKSVVQFALLFGATWLTNALVFGAILTSVLIAINIISRVKTINLRWWYIVLILTLLVQFIVPLKLFLGWDQMWRYMMASGITFGPVFVAEVIFAYTFKQSKDNSTNYAMNMLGAVVGGMVEYAAMLTGYRILTLLVAGCYVLAFFWPEKRRVTRKKV